MQDGRYSIKNNYKFAMIKKNSHTYPVDLGRLIILPIISLIMAGIVVGFYGDITKLDAVSIGDVSKLTHQLLLICFYALIIFLYFMRSSAKSTTKSATIKIIAVVSAFLPFAISFLSVPSDNPDLMFVANFIAVTGMVISLYSLFALGKSFSIIPQARTLVQTGPYKFVRHPLYLGEFIALMGIVLARFSISAITIFCLFIALQIFRALQEEKLLTSALPEYESYSLMTARFIPGIF